MFVSYVWAFKHSQLFIIKTFIVTQNYVTSIINLGHVKRDRDWRRPAKYQQCHRVQLY